MPVTEKKTIGGVNTVSVDGSYEINGSYLYDLGDVLMEVDAFRTSRMFRLSAVRFDQCPAGDTVCVGLPNRELFLAEEDRASIVLPDQNDHILNATVRTIEIPERSKCS